MSASVPDIGKVAAGSANTSFTVSATDGSVSIGAGGAQFIPYSATRSSLQTVTVTCVSSCGSSVIMHVTAGAASGRMGVISGFTASLASPFTARQTNGLASASGSPLSFTITSPKAGASVTFGLGLTVPVNTSGTLGPATSAYTVQAGSSGSGAASAKATVEGRLTISKVSDLSYGVMVLNKGVSGSAIWDAAANTFSLSPSNLAVLITSSIPVQAPRSIGTFDVTGTPGQQVNFSPLTTIQLFNAANNELDITVATTAQGAQSIPSAPNAGTLEVRVGGSLPLTDGMHTGHYTGTFTITVNYQ